jgi:DNA/RNA endonuclease YhcR with UshA esterase domain
MACWEESNMLKTVKDHNQKKQRSVNVSKVKLPQAGRNVPLPRYSGLYNGDRALYISKTSQKIATTKNDNQGDQPKKYNIVVGINPSA